MLYLVCTPIGNLKDISLRAIETLKSVSLILAEDTRHSAVLCSEYGITAPMESYQKFNEKQKCDSVINKLRSGMDIALISDAGTPLISDPGAVLIQEAVRQNIEFTVVGSSCAFVSAAVLSGFDLRSLAFGGFLPEKQSARREYLNGFKGFCGTLAFYVSPHSFEKDVAAFYEAFGKRRAVLVREISKKFEECVRFTLDSVPQFTQKGEYVLVIEGKPPENELNGLTVYEHVKYYVDGGLDKKEAIKKVAAERNVSKSEIYRQVIEL